MCYEVRQIYIQKVININLSQFFKRIGLPFLPSFSLCSVLYFDLNRNQNFKEGPVPTELECLVRDAQWDRWDHSSCILPHSTIARKRLQNKGKSLRMFQNPHGRGWGGRLEKNHTFSKIFIYINKYVSYTNVIFIFLEHLWVFPFFKCLEMIKSGSYDWSVKKSFFWIPK